MASNELTFNQISTLLNAINRQATGTGSLQATDTHSFVTQAQATLKAGYDPVLGAISQVLSRTIFSIRPYSAKFPGMMESSQKWGNHVRKINIADSAYVDDDRSALVDGQSVDQQLVRKPNLLQTNFYGENVFEDYYTIYKDQLDVAFSGPDEFAQFISLVTTNANDKLEMSRENLSRAMIANYIGAKLVTAGNAIEDAESVVHLLTEYNTLCGLTGDDALTSSTVYQPENFGPFMKWVYSRVASLSALLTERLTKFHVNPTVGGVAKEILRHVPFERQRVYLYAPAMYQTEARVLADAYHDNYLKYADHETVNFWQSAKTRDKILVHPNYMAADGTYGYTAQDVEQAGVFGVIMDEEVMGWTPVNQWQQAAPFNARGGYTTVWLHETQRSRTDMTESGIILLLD